MIHVGDVCSAMNHLTDYEQDGVVLIPSFLSADEVAAVRAELERYIRDDLASKPLNARTLEKDEKTVRNLWRLEEHNDFFRALGEREDIKALIAPLVHGEPVLVGVETFNKPARIGSGVPYHQDNAYFCQTPPDMLTVWIAIDAVTEANGPVFFVKGSHQVGMLPTRPRGVRGNRPQSPQATTASRRTPPCCAPTCTPNAISSRASGGCVAPKASGTPPYPPTTSAYGLRKSCGLRHHSPVTDLTWPEWRSQAARTA
jgi:hypothetical protein